MEVWATPKKSCGELSSARRPMPRDWHSPTRIVTKVEDCNKGEQRVRQATEDGGYKSQGRLYAVFRIHTETPDTIDQR
jgi:methylphosphotriester-DNA--protein-cysteine methyltransferase